MAVVGAGAGGPGGHASRMHPRHGDRRRAIDLLYQADVTGRPAGEVLEDWISVGEDVPPFARELVTGVTEHLAELDALLGSHSEGWTVERMAVVDRTILRVAAYELLHRPDVPASVAISEAVEAANELSTEDSGRFVNGILGRIARDLEAARGVQEPAPPEG